MPLRYEQVPIEVIRQLGEDFAHADEWLNERGYRADVAATRRLRPDLLDLRTWLAATGADLITAFLRRAPARTGRSSDPRLDQPDRPTP